jgi:hypothetical protein
MNYRSNEEITLSRYKVTQKVAAPAGLSPSQESLFYRSEPGAFAKIAKNGRHSPRVCLRTGLPVRER